MKFTAAILLVLGGSLSSSAFSIPPTTSSTGRALATQIHAEAQTRVVVTGLGVISGCGIGHEQFFQACLDGKSSLAKVQRFDAQHYPCQIASEVPDSMFNPEDHFTNPKNVRSNDRFTHFAVAAARQALKDAGLGDTPETLTEPSRIGVMVGTAFGGVETFEKETLKLAAKPERPKVRTLKPSNLLHGDSTSCLTTSCHKQLPMLRRYHPLPSPHFSATQLPVLLELNAVAKDPTTVSHPRVQVDRTQLGRLWA